MNSRQHQMDHIQSFYKSAEVESRELLSEIPENVRQNVIQLNSDWLKLRAMTTATGQSSYFSLSLSSFLIQLGQFSWDCWAKLNCCRNAFIYIFCCHLVVDNQILKFCCILIVITQWLFPVTNNNINTLSQVEFVTLWNAVLAKGTHLEILQVDLYYSCFGYLKQLFCCM